jgi:hypothetical protein
MKNKRVILGKLDSLIGHYFNSTLVDSWKYDQFRKVLYNKVFTDTEEELVFKCLMYIYDDFIDYSFAFDVSEVVKLLRTTLSDNKKTRTWYKKIRLIEQYARGTIISDKVVINLLLEALEDVIHKNLDRMIGKPWTKLERVVNLENPIQKQLDAIDDMLIKRS